MAAHPAYNVHSTTLTHTGLCVLVISQSDFTAKLALQQNETCLWSHFLQWPAAVQEKITTNFCSNWSWGTLKCTVAAKSRICATNPTWTTPANCGVVHRHVFFYTNDTPCSVSWLPKFTCQCICQLWLSLWSQKQQKPDSIRKGLHCVNFTTVVL